MNLILLFMFCYFLSKHQTVRFSVETYRLLYLLGAYSDASVINRTIAYVISDVAIICGTSKQRGSINTRVKILATSNISIHTGNIDSLTGIVVANTSSNNISTRLRMIQCTSHANDISLIIGRNKSFIIF